MNAATIQPDIKRRHTYETRLATLYVVCKGRCDHCRKNIEHYLCSMIWTLNDGSELLIHKGRGHSCESEMILAALDRVSARRKAQRAGR